MYAVQRVLSSVFRLMLSSQYCSTETEFKAYSTEHGHGLEAKARNQTFRLSVKKHAQTKNHQDQGQHTCQNQLTTTTPTTRTQTINVCGNLLKWTVFISLSALTLDSVEVRQKHHK